MTRIGEVSRVTNETDLHVRIALDGHHTVEDTGIALAQVLAPVNDVSRRPDLAYEVEIPLLAAFAEWRP